MNKKKKKSLKMKMNNFKHPEKKLQYMLNYQEKISKIHLM
jgi:hypothetical protein